MARAPRVSIGLITYNQVDIAPDAVRSALAQRWDDLQVVVSDDGSRDGTAEALLAIEAADPRLKVITSPVNTGITANMNRMYAACDGDYYAAIGGDDQIHPDRTRRQVEVLEADPTLAAVVTGCADFVDDPARPVALRDPTKKFGRSRITARDLVRTGNRIAPSPAWMYRRAFAPDRFDPRIPRASDGMFSFQVATRGDIALIPDPLTYYRVSPDSAVGQGLGWEPLGVFALIEAEHPGFLRELRTARALEYATLGSRALKEGRRADARALLWESVRAEPRLRPALAWAAAHLPEGGLRLVRRLRGRSARDADVG